MILVHTSTVVHSMIRSMRRPLLVLASIITWLGVVFWIRAITTFSLQDMCQSIDVSSFQKKIRFGTRITELNALGILFTLFGAFWYRYENEMVEKNGHSTKRGVLHTRPLGNLVALSWKPESICSPCELLLILCSFFLGRCLWLPCFQKKHLQPFANNDYSVCLRCAIWTLAQPWILLPRFMLEVASKTSSSKPKSHSEIDHPF